MNILPGVVDQTAPLKEPLIAPTTEMTPEQVELLQLREFRDSVRPHLARVNDLIAVGWLQARQGENLIDVMIREITLSRAERRPPGMEPDFTSVCMSAFATMCDVLAKSIPNSPMAIHQQRHNAFSVAVGQLLPVIRNDAVLSNYREIVALMDFHIKNHQVALSSIMGPGADDDGRLEKIKTLQAQIESLEAFRREIQEISVGGLTPAQVLQRHVDGQKVPDSASVN